MTAISKELLLQKGFGKTNNDFKLYLVTHTILLIEGIGGENWYPHILQPPEMSFQEEQCVSLKFIQTMEQLETIISFIK